MPISKHMPETFAALGDPTRLAILSRLAAEGDMSVQDIARPFHPTRLAILSRLAAEGDMSVQDIARPFRMSLPAISQHLKVLERAGLITRGRDGQKRPCQLRAERLAEARQWLDNTREAWESRFDRLERFLANPEDQT
jgi:DNA-binding transcriptional ArsR family regulator